MRRSVFVALLLAISLGACQKKDTAPAQNAAPQDAGTTAAPQEKPAAEPTAAETAAADKLTKEHADVAAALVARLEASERKLKPLREDAAKLTGPGKSAAEKALADVDAEYLNLHADLTRLGTTEAADFENARGVLEEGVKSFDKMIEAAGSKITGKPAH